MVVTDEDLANDPKNGLFVMTKARIFKRQAAERTGPDRDKLLKQAIACIDQAIALMPDDKGEPLYNKACYQALLDPIGLKSAVLDNLKSAFDRNPGLRQGAKEDPDLDTLKQDDDFIDLMRTI
jgi:hypothetical protein